LSHFFIIQLFGLQDRALWSIECIKIAFSGSFLFSPTAYLTGLSL
jgi:hypothetical protein